MFPDESNVPPLQYQLAPVVQVAVHDVNAEYVPPVFGMYVQAVTGVEAEQSHSQFHDWHVAVQLV